MTILRGFSLTVAFCNCVVQGSVTLVIGRVQRALVLEQEIHYGYRTSCCCTVDWILAPAVADSSRCAIVDKNATDVEVLLGRDKVKGSLYVQVSPRM
jgi:hypothetical protein